MTSDVMHTNSDKRKSKDVSEPIERLVSATTSKEITTLEFEEPLSDEARSRESDETLLRESIAELDREIDEVIGEHDKTLQTKVSIKRGQSTSSLNSLDESCGENKMKYRDNFQQLWKGYKRILKDHSRLMSMVPNRDKRNNLQQPKLINHYLDDFALKVAAKKKRSEKKLLNESLGQDIDTFIGKKWKRRYFSILEAIDLLFSDFQMISNYLNGDGDGDESVFSQEEIQYRLHEIAGDGLDGIKFKLENDVTITLSSVFVSDLLSQLQVYRNELISMYHKKERLLQMLAHSKRQKTELRHFVSRLRNELSYASKKVRMSQDAMAGQLALSGVTIPTEASQSSPDQQDQKKSEIIRFEDRICELEKMLREEEYKRKKLHNRLQELLGNIRVYCRIRPNPKSCLKVESNDKIVVCANDLPEKMAKNWTTPVKCFIFDRVFQPLASQVEVFQAVQPLIVSCVDGYNVCIMAYGQTGSGKTFTMMGTADNPGVNRRAISELLAICYERKQWEFRLRLSVIEIYQEEARDLLSATQTSPPKTIKIRSTQDDEIIICGLTEYEVKTQENILTLLGAAEKNRSVAAHLLNQTSSRSHLVMLLKIDGENTIHNTTSRGTLTLCDLAGSENVTKSGATSGDRFHEATSINRSLTTLGRVFDSLRRRQKPVYRETKLTYLLKPTLGGDSKCLLFVNVRSEPANAEETVRALQFGQNAMQVIPEETNRKLSSTRKASLNN